MVSDADVCMLQQAFHSQPVCIRTHNSSIQLSIIQPLTDWNNRKCIIPKSISHWVLVVVMGEGGREQSNGGDLSQLCYLLTASLILHVWALLLWCIFLLSGWVEWILTVRFHCSRGCLLCFADLSLTLCHCRAAELLQGETNAVEYLFTIYVLYPISEQVNHLYRFNRFDRNKLCLSQV